MSMLMMLCSSFSGSNTRGVTVRVLTIFKAGRLLNIDLFHDGSIEEGTLHVHLIKLKAMVSSLGK
jgi:hypothetical protein